MKNIPKENTEAAPLSNANKEDVSKAVEDLPPDWYDKKEIRKFANYFVSTNSSSSKQTEGDKNVELKEEKVNDEESNSDESVDRQKVFCISNSQRKGINKSRHRKNSCAR